MPNDPKLINVFIAYSRKDVDYLNQLKTYLQPLHRNNTIKIWYDGEISPGSAWEQEIKRHLHDADIILMLVSADSLASDYFYDKEMAEAMQRHENGQTIVVPVILKDCAWELTALSKLQALPQDGKPISKWDSDSSAYANIVRGLYKSIDAVKERNAQQGQTQQGTPTGQISKTKKENDQTSTTKQKPVADNKIKRNLMRFGLPIIGLLIVFFMVKQFSGNKNNNRSTDRSVIENKGSSYAQLIEEAKSLMIAKKYGAAEKKFKEALVKKPKGEDATLGLAKIAEKKYNQYLSSGNVAFDKRAYQVALTNYNYALGVDKDAKIDNIIICENTLKGVLLYDHRDKQSYKTAVLKDGKTWMLENLNYQTSSASYCINDDQNYCNQRGRLYNWVVAQKACPPGWHLPSKEEWKNMQDKYNSHQLTTEVLSNPQFGGWRGANGKYYYWNDANLFWTKTLGPDDQAWMYMYNTSLVIDSKLHAKQDGLSCRCVKN